MNSKMNIQSYLPNTKSLVWSAISVFICIVSYTAVQYHKSSSIRAVYINIPKVEEGRKLLTTRMIADIISSIVPKDMSKTEISKLNLKLLEDIITKDSRVLNVEVYINGNNSLIIDVTPREPVLRIKNKNGEDYYVDKKGNRIAKVDKVTVRVPVVSGYLSDYDPEWKDLKSHDMHDIYKIANVLTEDELMKALIEQVYFDNDGYITLIPKIGREQIAIGSTDDLDYKIENLKESYKLIMKQYGWNNFKVMNLDIVNQIGLSKS